MSAVRLPLSLTESEKKSDDDVSALLASIRNGTSAKRSDDREKAREGEWTSRNLFAS